VRELEVLRDADDDIIQWLRKGTVNSTWREWRSSDSCYLRELGAFHREGNILDGS
jgi:hypothetical protein